MLILLLIVITNSLANAASSSSGGHDIKFGKDASLWVGLGLAHPTVSDPVQTVDFDYSGMVVGGAEVPVVGPLTLAIWTMVESSTGKTAYDYTDKANAHYTATNVALTQTTTVLGAGLQLRLINTSHFRLFAEGGGFIGTANLSYDMAGAKNISLGGVDPELSQKDVALAGSYVAGGLDLGIAHGFGMRVEGRAMRYQTAIVNALNKQKMKAVAGDGIVAVFKQF